MYDYDPTNHTDDKSMQLKVIPNPNTGIFIFEVNQSNRTGIIYVYGIDGKLYHQQFTNQKQTPLELRLKKGLYLVVYKTESKTESVKLIID